MQLRYLIVALLSLSLAGLALAQQPAPVQNAINRMARSLDVPADQIKVISVEGVDWPDTALGVHREGFMYLQVITPGFRVVLEGGGRRFEYHTDMGNRVVLADNGEGAVGRNEADETGGATKAPTAAAGGIADACRQDLARRLNLPLEKIKPVSVQPRVFPTAALGLPRPGEVYAQVQTPGYVIILFSGRDKYLYTATDKGCRYGGPVSSWIASALYLEPMENEPNFNGNLCQVSLAGNGGQVLIEAVSDFWPQYNGTLLAKRRTSRSGHELLYLDPAQGPEPRRLTAGVDIAVATVNADGSRWAAVVRPSLGRTWELTYGSLAGADKASVPLPDAGEPRALYWTLDQPVLALTAEDKTTLFQIDLSAAEPRWTPAGSYLSPDREQWILNKSETLVVETKEVNGQPVTRVVRHWFTGDDNPVVEIKGFKYVSGEVWPGRFLLLIGEREGRRVALTVDIATGEVLPTLDDAPEKVKISLLRPQGWKELVGDQLERR